jgi:hypothetical protein
MGKSLTGGSVPIGKTLLSGIIVDAQNPSVPLAGVRVRIVTEGGEVVNTQTDTSGQFAVETVSGQNFTVRVEPPNRGSSFSSEEFQIDLGKGENRLLIPLGRANTPIAPPVTAIRIQPSQIALQVGEQVQLRYEVEPSLPPGAFVLPVIIVQGGVGVMSTDGTFTATRKGRGVITAHFSGLTAKATVTVTSPRRNNPAPTPVKKRS